MSDLDRSSVLGPLTPTYMPYFPPHRSPLHSSSNTRQRDDYEFNSHFSPSSPSPLVLVTSEDDEDFEAPPEKPDRSLEGGYPASELPFASEPALESELEQGLPPLKKLKPDADSDTDGARLVQSTAHGMVLISAVKGILTRRTGSPRDSNSMPQSPLTSSPPPMDPCFIPWSRTLGNRSNNLSTWIPTSAPLSRRSSSGASSVCTGSLKAVRFASGHLTNSWSDPQRSQAILPGEVEGPVAAVMYLTHSAVAYDRSPIIVEDGLRLPPRAKPEDEVNEPTMRLDKKRRAKLNVEILKIGRDRLCKSPTDLSPKSDSKVQTQEPSEGENSLNLKSSSSMHKSYREVEEVDEEEEETPCSLEEEDEQVEEDDEESVEEQPSDDDEQEETEPTRCRRRASQTEPWGLGKWSSGEVFGCCDALGGF